MGNKWSEILEENGKLILNEMRKKYELKSGINME